MKTWWLELSLREKQTLIAGTMMIAIFLAYAWIWSPLHDNVTTMRQQIQHQQTLLHWMEVADKKITLLQSRATQSDADNTSSLLSYIQRQLDHSPLAGKYSECREADADGVQVRFKEVDFDHLITWLAKTSRQRHISISHFSVSSSNTPGIVSADVIVKSS